MKDKFSSDENKVDMIEKKQADIVITQPVNVSQNFTAKKDYTMRLGDGTEYNFVKGKEIIFTPPAGITREAIINALKSEEVI